MIDKVNIITSHVQNGKMIGWSPYLRYEKGIDWIEIANTLPLPSDRTAEISELPVRGEEEIKEDKSFEGYRYRVDLKNYTLITLTIFPEIKLQIVINDLIQLFNLNKTYDQQDKGLFLVLYNEVFNKELSHDELSKLSNETLNTILNRVNELFEKRLLLAPHQLINSEKKLRLLSVYLNTIKDSLVKYLPGEERIAEVLKKIVDYHNLYMSEWKNSRKREAYENFISKTMWLISGDPRNWILGLISVDTSTGPWKDLAGGSESAEASKRLTGNSAYGLINLLVLTLEGRLNVGIVANSLKAFEAATQALYSILEEGNPEKIQQIFVDLQIGSKQISSIANLWVKDPVFKILDEKTQEMLLAFASSDDAYIELSSLLSLAVDNAKDPTLSKINGNKNMIGLYTAGLIAGLSKEELISIINSKSGEFISDYLTSNIFNSHKKYFRDPIKVFQHLFSQTPENLKVPNLDTELGQQLKAILTKKGDDGFYISESDRLDEALTLIKDNNDDSYKTFKNELYSLKEIANIKEFDFYTSPDGTRHSCFRALYKIARVNAEFKNLMIATGLNLGYANSIEDLFDFAYRFANILSQFKTYGNFKKDDDADLQTLIDISEKLNILDPKSKSTSPKIDLVSYVENPIFYILGSTIITLKEYDTKSDDIKFGYTPMSYRQAIRNYYQKHKYLINIFDVFELSLLYKGYLEGMGAVIKGSSAISIIHKSINEALNPVIDTLKVSKKLDRKYVIKKIEQYFHIKRTKLFWEKLGNDFTFTVNYKGYTLKNVSLNSERNREIFKNYFETIVFPALQSKFPDNKFISSLYPRLFDYPDHSIGRKIASNVSTRLVSPLDKLRFLEVKQDIARLQSELFNGTSIITLFFVYDLVTTNGLNIPHNLAPFFEDLRYTDRNLFIIKYEEFVKNPKDHNDQPIDTWFNLNELDEICQFCAPEVLSLSDTKYKYVYITDLNTKKYALYERIDSSQQDTVSQNNLLDIDMNDDSYIDNSIDDNVDNDVLDFDDNYNEDNFSEELDNGVSQESGNNNYKLVNKEPNNITLNAQVLLADVEIEYGTSITSNADIDDETKKILQNLIDVNLDALSLALDQNC